jgi:hypothetical protein
MHNCNEYIIAHGKDISKRVKNGSHITYDKKKQNVYEKQQQNHYNLSTLFSYYINL